MLLVKVYKRRHLIATPPLSPPPLLPYSPSVSLCNVRAPCGALAHMIIIIGTYRRSTGSGGCPRLRLLKLVEVYGTNISIAKKGGRGEGGGGFGGYYLLYRLSTGPCALHVH